MYEELAWAAGFFDAEGCSSFANCTVVSVSQSERAPLDRFHDAVEVGSVRGPFKNSGLGTRPMWSYQAYAKNADAVLTLLGPFLSAPKVRQAIRATRDPSMHACLNGHLQGMQVVRRSAQALAWAAGFFDGDGCFSFAPSTSQACVSIVQNEREPLERFQCSVGLGKIYGPYERPPTQLGTEPFSNYRAHGFEKVQAIAAMLWPWLGETKRAQAKRVLRLAREQSRVSRCRKGHEKILGLKSCPACVREHWRMYREGTLFEEPIPYLIA